MTTGDLIILLFCILFSSSSSLAQPRKFGKVQKYIDQATNQNLPGVAVYIKTPKHGPWIGTSGFADIERKTPLREDHIFALGSIGKLYNATAILKLAEEGNLKLHDKIEAYLPEEVISNLPNADVVTIRHLLGHTTGFINYEADPELNRLYLGGRLKLDTLTHLDALRRYVFGKDTLIKPGMKYHYSSTNYMLLAMIMDELLPEGHAEYLRKNILYRNKFCHTLYKQTPSRNLPQHYGDLNQDGIIENVTGQTIETTNWFIGDDGIYAPIEEACNFLESLMKGEILDENSLKEMMTWNDARHPDHGLGLMADKGFPYKFLMGYSGRGIGMTTDLYYFPKQDMTVAIFCNAGLRGASPSFRKTFYKMRSRIVKKLFLF